MPTWPDDAVVEMIEDEAVGVTGEAGRSARAVVLCDLDGVVWLAHRPIEGSVEAIARLRAAGHPVWFVTNNSVPRVEEHEAALAAIGVPAEGAVLTAAMAAANLLVPGSRVLVCGGDGIVQSMERAGAEVIPPDLVDAGAPVDAVVVGLLRSFDYGWLARTSSMVRRGAMLIGTNEDATYPTPSGPVPGGGAILAAVRTAAGTVPTVAGKPHEPMAALVRSVVGVERLASAVMVGDRPDTDGRFARRIGCRYAHVRSGVTGVGDPLDPAPDLVADDLAGIADRLLAEPPVSPGRQ